MARIINITDKLSLEKTTIQIGSTTVTVIDDAETVLKMISIVSDDDKGEIEGIKEAYDLLFSEEDKEKIKSLNLNLTSFMELVKTAMSIATGNYDEEEEQEQGEEKTPATT